MVKFSYSKGIRRFPIEVKLSRSMEFFNKNLKTSLPDSPKEIEDRLRRRYLDRLSQRVKRLRKLLVERNWEELRAECGHLAASGDSFGFSNLTDLAIAAQESI